jgi:hypothetical protein
MYVDVEILKESNNYWVSIFECEQNGLNAVHIACLEHNASSASILMLILDYSQSNLEAPHIWLLYIFLKNKLGHI